MFWHIAVHLCLLPRLNPEPSLYHHPLFLFSFHHLLYFLPTLCVLTITVTKLIKLRWRLDGPPKKRAITPRYHPISQGSVTWNVSYHTSARFNLPRETGLNLLLCACTRTNSPADDRIYSISERIADVGSRVFNVLCRTCWTYWCWRWKELSTKTLLNRRDTCIIY